MGYGGDSGTMNRLFFKEITMESSVWGLKVLQLKSVCWMDPKTWIENIPVSWKKIDIAIYHGHSGCKLHDTKINILACSQVEALELKAKALKNVWTKKFDSSQFNGDPKN